MTKIPGGINYCLYFYTRKLKPKNVANKCTGGISIPDTEPVFFPLGFSLTHATSILTGDMTEYFYSHPYNSEGEVDFILN